MQALIVHDDPAASDRLARALSQRGFMVTQHSDQDQAIDFVRNSVTDLVVLKQVIAGRHTTSVALAAEYHHPSAVTLLLSTRSRAGSVDLFEQIPSLHAILSVHPDPQLVSALGVHAVQNPNAATLVLSPGQRVVRAKPLQAA